MKKLLTILVAVAATLTVTTSLTSCKDDKKNQILDPNAKISIKAAKTPASIISKADGYLSPVEVVQKTTDLAFQSHDYPNEPYCNVGVSEEQKDLTTPKLMMWGEQIIRNGALNPFFIEAYDVVIVTRQNQDRTKPISDTLAYIPNAQLRTAEIAIKTAYAAENYDEVYRLFDAAYQFTPINGADWLELKRQGKN